MKVFVIHRSAERHAAFATLKRLFDSSDIDAELVYLKLPGRGDWRQRALVAIKACEAVVVYNPTSAHSSENVSWEITTARGLDKPIIEVFSDFSRNDASLQKLKKIYRLEDEFIDCFDCTELEDFRAERLLKLYEIMINSSESLLQRRQITNGFFFTVVGGLVVALGFVLKEKLVVGSGSFFLVFPIMVAIFMCRSWESLLKNYGRLNRAKFSVINEIEKQFEARVFAAEWIALGKGRRPSLYQSFTESEANVPRWFQVLLIILLAYVIYEWGKSVIT